MARGGINSGLVDEEAECGVARVDHRGEVSSENDDTVMICMEYMIRSHLRGYAPCYEPVLVHAS